MVKSLEHLLEKEYSMGNGQCPECCGCPPEWFGTSVLRPGEVGHRKKCKLAISIRELGGETVFLGEFKSDKEYEFYWDENGFLDTREKTEGYCLFPEIDEKLRELLSGLFNKVAQKGKK